MGEPLNSTLYLSDGWRLLLMKMTLNTAGRPRHKSAHHVATFCGTVWVTPFLCHFYQPIFLLTEIMASVTERDRGKNGIDFCREKRGDCIRWEHCWQDVLLRLYVDPCQNGIRCQSKCLWTWSCLILMYSCVRFMFFNFINKHRMLILSFRFSLFHWKGVKWILCFVGRASLYNLVHKTNLVHSLFLVYLSISTCFGQLWSHHQKILGSCYAVWMTAWYAGWRSPCIPDSHPFRITSNKCRKNTVVSPDDGPIFSRNM